MERMENIDEIKYPDEATKLVLDIVYKVIEPTIPEKIRTNLIQNNMVGPSDGIYRRPNVSAYDISYKRWSNEGIVDFSAPSIPPSLESQQLYAKSGLDFWLPYMTAPNPISCCPIQFKNSFRNNTNVPQSNRYNQFHPRRSQQPFCRFCKKNGESIQIYTSHQLYENGKVCCPVLIQCVCKICGQKGHTMSHCFKNPAKTSVVKMIHQFNAEKFLCKGLGY